MSIKVKAKECKSCNPKTKGLGCGKPSFKRKYGLCQRCFLDWLLYTPEGQKHLEQSTLKGKKKARKDKEREEHALIKKLKIDTTDYKSKLQTKVNEIARLIDTGLPCLARGNHAKQMHGGHVLSRGSQPSMRYNLHNIHRQSAQSNHWQQDDIKMREGLAREYGNGYLDFLIGLKATPPLKYSNVEYKEFYEIACEIARDMRLSGEVFNTKERIKKRNWVNIKIGMYYLKHSRYDG